MAGLQIAIIIQNRLHALTPILSWACYRRFCRKSSWFWVAEVLFWVSRAVESDFQLFNTVIAEIFVRLKISYSSVRELSYAINFRTSRTARHTLVLRTRLLYATNFHTFSQKYEINKIKSRTKISAITLVQLPCYIGVGFIALFCCFSLFFWTSPPSLTRHSCRIWDCPFPFLPCHQEYIRTRVCNGYYLHYGALAWRNSK